MLSHYWVGGSSSANWPDTYCRHCGQSRGAPGVGVFCGGPPILYRYVARKAVQSEHGTRTGEK